MNERLILIVLGIGFILFSFPQIRAPIMTRLFNEGFVTPKRVKSEEAEIIKFAGPNVSLLMIGVVLIIIGIIL